MTKQEAIKVVREEIQRVRDENVKNCVIDPITSTACACAANKMEWVLDTLAYAED